MMTIETRDLQVWSVPMQRLKERPDVFPGKMPQGYIYVLCMSVAAGVDCHSSKWPAALNHLGHRCPL